MGSRECCVARAQAQSNEELVSILQSKLRGRRCELVNLTSQSEMNGRTCIVEEHLKSSNQYKVTVQGRRKEKIIVSPDNLKRRDQTPQTATTTSNSIMDDSSAMILTQRRIAKPSYPQ